MALYRRPSTTAMTRHPHSIGGAMYVMHKVAPAPFTPEVPTAPLAPVTPVPTVNDYPGSVPYTPKRSSGGLDIGRRRAF